MLVVCILIIFLIIYHHTDHQSKLSWPHVQSLRKELHLIPITISARALLPIVKHPFGWSY